MLNLVGKRFWFFGLSLLVIIPGIIALAVWHLNLGLDFTSGTVVDLQFSKQLDQNTIKTAFANAGAKDLTVVTSQDTIQDPQYLFWLRFNVAIDNATENDVLTALNTLAGQLKQGGGANANGSGDFSRLVTYDGGKTYFSILIVQFTGLDKPPAIDQIRKAIAGIKDLKTSQQPTPTPTQIPSPTPTSTGTPATATPTATNTPAPTATDTPTPTPTGQPTGTATPAPTGSPTAAPSATATPTPERTISVLLCANTGDLDPVSNKPATPICDDGHGGQQDGVQQGTTRTIFTITTSSALENDTINNIEFGLEQAHGSYLLEQSKDSVGPTIASETTQRAFLAVLIASVAILLYIWFAFRKVAKPWRYGACAIIALLHDALVVLGMAAIIGHFDHNYQVDSLFVTAVLTVIGFSVHDTIVVFDRIRENFQRRTSETLEQVINASLVQTMARSLNTSLTVLFTLSALTLFGGVSIRTFTLTLLIGIFSGTYSSIFNASMLLVSWEKGELGRLFGFKPKPPADPRARRAARARA